MIFRRTPEGESNKRLFLRVDAIVYVEGGRGFTMEDVMAGNYDEYSIDIQFWQRMFSVFDTRYKLDFRAVGSKPTLLSLADDILAGKIDNVIVAMDRDHDEYRDVLKGGHNVLYTKGYSWECDVWSPEVTEEVFFALCPVSRVSVDIRTDIDEMFSELKRQVRWLVYADIVLGMHGSSLLPRNKPDAVFQLDGAGRPTVRREELKKVLSSRRQHRAGAVRAGRVVSFDPLSNCVGHIVSAFCYRLLTYLFRRYPSRGRISRQHVEAVGIEKFGQLCGDGRLGDAVGYYREILARVRVQGGPAGGIVVA